MVRIPEERLVVEVMRRRVGRPHDRELVSWRSALDTRPAPNRRCCQPCSWLIGAVGRPLAGRSSIGHTWTVAPCKPLFWGS